MFDQTEAQLRDSDLVSVFNQLQLSKNFCHSRPRAAFGNAASHSLKE
jgi:hypothetical protein